MTKQSVFRLLGVYLLVIPALFQSTGAVRSVYMSPSVERLVRELPGKDGDATFCPPGRFLNDGNCITTEGRIQERSTEAATAPPVVASNVIPNAPKNGQINETYTVLTGIDGAPGGADPNNNAYSLLVLDGPPKLLSSIAAESDWVVLGCSGKTEGIQRVTAYCGKHEDDASSGCAAIFEGGAPNTVVKLPSGCGGPYARLHSAEVDQSRVLPAPHAAQKPSGNPVYALEFDFEFYRISETRSADDGPVLMRMDVSTMPGTFAEMDLAAPGSPVRRDLDRRWFGSDLASWAARINKVEKNQKAHLNMATKPFNTTLFSLSKSCTNPGSKANFTASLNLTASGTAQAAVEYGFYLQGSLVPPQVNQAYVYANAAGSASLGLDLSGKAAVQFSSGRIRIIPEIPFPGASVSIPGIVSIGPTFNVYAQINGNLTVSGHVAVTPTYTIPPATITLGITGGSTQGNSGPNVAVTANKPVFAASPTYDVALDGALSIHAIPQVDIGVTILPNSPVTVQATAFLNVDGSLTASFNADKTGVNAAVGAGIDVNVGATGRIASKALNLGPYALAHTNFTLYQTHLSFPQSSLQCRSHADSMHGMVEGDFDTAWTMVTDGHAFGKRSVIDGILSCPSPAPGKSAALCEAD